MSVNIKEMLKLAVLTEQFGTLHELQLHQLKNWPFVLFEGISQFKLTTEVENKKVIYDFSLDKGWKDDSVDKFKILNEWVKNIMGPKWSVEVLSSNIQVFNGNG